MQGRGGKGKDGKGSRPQTLPTGVSSSHIITIPAAREEGSHSKRAKDPSLRCNHPHHAAKQQAHHLGVTFSESQLSWVQWGGGAQGPVGRDEKWAGLSLYPLPFPWRCGGACQRPDPLPTTCLEPARRLMSQLLSATPVPPLLPTGPATSDLRGADSLQDGG